MDEAPPSLLARLRGGVGRRLRRRRRAVRTRLARELPLPGFFVLGAQKAGTTWLHEMLGRHPDVFLPKPKELHFFDHRHRYREGIDWYAEHFVDAPRRALRGEATPNYLWCSDRHADWASDHFDASWKYCTPERIAARTGHDTRFVVLLREPVARAVSGYYHHVRVGGRIDPDATFLDVARTWGIAHMGFYAAHLQRYWEVFEPDQFLVMLFDDLVEAPQETLDRTCDHLGLSRLRLPDDVLTSRVHGGTKFQGDDGVYYADEDHTRVAITPDDLAALAEVYRAPNDELAALLGVDLSRWRHPVVAR